MTVARLDEAARRYWDEFYARGASSGAPLAPSSFATWVEPRLADDEVVVDVGFGNGRDSLWFAGCGRTVVGFDFAPSAVESATKRATADNLPASFDVLDLNDRADAAEKVSREWPASPLIYGRFLLHALTDGARSNFFEAISRVRPQCKFAFEFRTEQDAVAPHEFGDDHYRNFLNGSQVRRELENAGASISHHVEGRGLAPYRNEDPHICRLAGEFGCNIKAASL